MAILRLVCDISDNIKKSAFASGHFENMLYANEYKSRLKGV